MTSSLAEQLQRLATPQTSTLERGKKRPSLLFDPKEAASLKKETVYEIGLSGLEELISKDEDFRQFTNTLFSMESKLFERCVETAESNRKLDKHIRKFFLLLSPYFLLHCSYKALEWLIYRYSVHEFNREAILMLVFPYHESNIFVRVVQLLKISDAGDPWFFLKAIQKPGVHLAKKTLLNHAASDPYFIKFVSNFIIDIVKMHKKTNTLTVAFNFYCSIFTGAIEYSKEVSESTLTQMLPALMKGLKSDIPDFCAASYVIIARLLTKCTLSETILDKFVQFIANSKVTTLKEESVLMYIVLYQSQSSYNKIPDEVVEQLTTQEWFPKILQNLNCDGCLIYPFLKELIQGLVKLGLEEEGMCYRKYLLDLLDQLKIDEDYVGTVLNAVLDSVPSKMKNKPEEAKIWLTEVVETIEKQYPTQFDTEVHKIFMSTDTRRGSLHKIFKNAFALKQKFDIFDKLYHPNALIRRKAMKFITNNFDQLRDVEKDMLRISLKDRLRDENVKVVKEALNLIKTIGIAQDSEVKEVLIELLGKHGRLKEKCGIILTRLIDLLCISDNAKDYKVFLNIFPLLLPDPRDGITYAELIVNSELFSKCGFFEHFNKHTYSKQPGDFASLILNSLNSVDNKKHILHFFDSFKEIDHGKFTPLHIYTLAIITSHIVSDDWSLHEILYVLEIMENLFKQVEVKAYKMKNSILGNFEVCKKGKLPVNGFLTCISDMISKIIEKPSELVDFSVPSDQNKFLITSTRILYHYDDLHSEYIEQFNESMFETVEAKIGFLFHLAVFEDDSRNKNDVLSILMKELQKGDLDNETLFDSKLRYVPYILILMTSHDQGIREKTFGICRQILETDKLQHQSYSFLISNLLQYQEQIILDSDQLPLVVSNILNANRKEEILNDLVGLCTDSTAPRYLVAGILRVLSHMNTIKLFEVTSKIASEILDSKSDNYNDFETYIVQNNIQRFDESIGKDLAKGMNSMEFLESVVKNDKLCLNNGQNSPSLLLLEHITEPFVSSLESEIQFVLLDSIIEVSTSTQDPKIVLASNRVFKHINLDINQILPQLNQMNDVQSPQRVNVRKRRSISQIPTVDILETVEWKKGVRILELIQDKKKIFNLRPLLPILFNILKKCLDFDEQSAVEYPKQLILSSILHVCHKLDGEKISENVFNMESVVQCVRASTNPQTHHHALLVLAHCATLIPSQVLHHIMAIFTFMGSSVLRHDDAYSFQLITKVVDTVIPILIRDNNKKTITSVLSVFVDALLDVPEHRRKELYTHLLQQINPSKHLHIFLLLVFISHCIHNNREKMKIPKHKFENHSVLKRLDIAANLTSEFSPDVVFTSFISLIQYLRSLPVEPEDFGETKLEIDISNLTPKEFRHLKYTILIFINNLISSKEFVNKIAVLAKDELELLEAYYKEIIISILSFIQKTFPLVEKNLHTTQGQYWKAVQHQSLEILDGINAILTPEMFLLVIKGLMAHNLTHVKKRALDLLNTKLQHHSVFIEECDKEQVHQLLNPLIKIIDELIENDNEQEAVVIQTALLSLKLIIKNVGLEDTEKYTSVLEFITNTIQSQRAEGNVLASLILCLAELCVTLRARAIQYLPNFMPFLLKILKQQKNQESPTLLCLSVLTVVHKVLETLSLFISPYLKKLLIEITQLMSKWGNPTDDPQLTPFLHKLDNIKQKLGETIAPRILIPAIQECYTHLVEKNKFNAIGSLMLILSQNITYLTGSSLTNHLPELSDFFMNALEFRNEGKCDIDQTNDIESQIIQAFSILILKLSETTFRPLFYKIYDWAIRDDVKDDRTITFYSICSGLAKNLKSLFVLFAGIFINNAAQILDTCNKIKTEELHYQDERKNIILLEKVLETLTFVFKHTTTKFINKERFGILMLPIVDQLENDFDGMEQLEKRVNDFVIPCIAQFTIATADDSLWKQMNYQILLKMRNTNAKIRLISLQCLAEVVTQLGEDFLPLLPETIPFLSELLEDEDESVEKSCKKAIQEMEKVLGESLQKYF